jgi:hypothetical protein
MADVKISGLPASTVPLAGTEVLPIVQSGVTKQVANNDLRPKQIQSNATSGVLQVAGPGAATTRVMTTPDANFTVARIDAAQSFTGDQTLSTGNLIIGTSGKGIDFSATAGTGTSELLADYEEGTWTPTAVGGTTAGTTTYVAQSGRYTKIGRQVTLQFNIEYSATTGTGSLLIGGLPFASGILTTGSIITNFYNWTGGTYLSLVLPASSSSINIYGGNDDGAWTVQTITNESAVFTGTITYIV